MTTVTFTAAGSSTWTAPAGVTSVLVEVWGAGGGGGGSNQADADFGGGGGGGEYAAQTLTVHGGGVYSYTVGAVGSAGSGASSPGTAGGAGGNSTFGPDDGSATVTGHGGGGGGGGATGSAGSAGSGSSNTTHHNGGAGGSGVVSGSSSGGGGGSSGGTSLAGNAGTAGTGINGGGAGGTAVSGGGPGGNGGTNTLGGGPSPGSAPVSGPGGGGGGAGGSGTVSENGGTGFAGQVQLTFTSTVQPDVPKIQPGPTWLDLFKPGMPKPRPFLPQYTETEQGPLNIVLPVPLLSLTGTDVNPASMPSIQPGPAWLDQFKPGMRKNRPQQPVYPYRTAGEQGPLNIVLPVPLIALSGQDVNPASVPAILPGPQWLDQFKPGFPRRNRPVTPPDPGVKLITAPLSVLLPPPVILLSGTRLRQPENLGAVLTLPSPNGVTVEVTESATCTLPAIDATLVLPSPNATLVGWTMLTAPLTLSEFNDVTIDIAVTQNGSPYNLTGVTVNLLFKSAAGTPDGNALIFSSGGVSPAITIINAAGGLAVAVIPNTDLDAEIYFFYRVDVVNAGLTNTCLYGPITWISL